MGAERMPDQHQALPRRHGGGPPALERRFFVEVHHRAVDARDAHQLVAQPVHAAREHHAGESADRIDLHQRLGQGRMAGQRKGERGQQPLSEPRGSEQE